jgi:2-keto-4-pentenoate hydratase/2-oxohepta-3-ene-1,7-dioic acid hydratase in catechol pathway
MKRTFEEIVNALFCELSYPAGAVLLTGTGVVPPTRPRGATATPSVSPSRASEHSCARSPCSGRSARPAAARPVASASGSVRTPGPGAPRYDRAVPLSIERPSKIVCVGLNYRDHAEETGAPLPDAPLLFAKWPNALIGSGEAILLPEESHEVDYEAELGVVINTTVRRVSETDALNAVRGYICVNDVSARDLQFGDGQWTRGKSPDTFCPVGPRLVPREEIPDPQALAIRCILNGETMQDSSTANMIFSVAEIIAYVSRSITLEPGDLIATGTPAGVGVFRDPKVLLKDGDEVTVEVEGLGALTNPVTKGT